MFSVVIPLFNKAHTIQQTLQSVLNQTFSNFEVLIVNDGSTDDGINVICQFFNDPRIRIINQENQGVSAARNRGIKESKFNYIAFLDGDDEWKPDFLKAIKSAISQYPKAGLYGTSSLHVNYLSKESNDATIPKYRNKIIKINCFNDIRALPHTSAIVVKKSSLYKLDKDLNVFPVGMRACEDWACFHRLALVEDLIYIGNPQGIRNNNVKGQITGDSEDNTKALHIDGVRYYNLVFDFWKKTNSTNNKFISYSRYNILHAFKNWLIQQEWDLIELYLNGLNKGYLYNYECNLLIRRKMRVISILYIYTTKIISKIFR